MEKLTPNEDELVRYMSNLPSFLEKGKNVKDKALNVGVLDWKRLEKWQYSKKLMSHNKPTGCSPSSSNTSVFSTDGSSTHSSWGPSRSPARQRMHRLSLHSPLEASPNVDISSSSIAHSSFPIFRKEQNYLLRSHPLREYGGGRNSQNSGAFTRNAGTFQDSVSCPAYNLGRQQKVLGPQLRHGVKACDLKSLSEMGHNPSFHKFEVVGKPHAERNQTTKKVRSQKTKLNSADQDCSARKEAAVIIMPRDGSETSCSGVASSSYFAGNSRFSVETGPKSILGRGSENLLLSEVESHRRSTGFGSLDPECVTSSLQASNTPLQLTDNGHNKFWIDTDIVKEPSQESDTFSFPARRLGNPSRSRTEERNPVAGLQSTSAAKPEELDVRRNSESIPKGRNPSPIRRLSFSMGKIIKNAGSRDNSPVRLSSSEDCTAKSGREGANTAASIDSSDKSSANSNRGRSSPLRRLFDPFLKSRDSDSSQSIRRHSSSAAGSRKSCSDQIDFCNSVKVKSRFAVDSSTTVTESHHNSKSEPLPLQALLQVSFKNGFPLFTFAIDNDSDILAATVRDSLFLAKGHHKCTYTFFAVRETKRKSGIWLNKGDNSGYVPNFVAQMKVTDSIESPHTEYENADFCFTREFHLFAMDVRDEDHGATDFHPTNELAAIIVKLPKRLGESHTKDGQLHSNWLESSLSRFTKNMQDSRSCADSDDDSQNPEFPPCLNFSTQVILPGGIHTVPSKGEISSLVQRWRTGGSCDCGGWDLGCKLLIYTNKRQYVSKTSSSATCPSQDMFQLFSQVGHDNRPILRLAPSKERIYSVEFSSSLSLLQAFAVCISYFDCRRPAELSEPSLSVAGKITDEVGVLEIPSRMKTLNQVDAPARYVSYPPHSPVGRV